MLSVLTRRLYAPTSLFFLLAGDSIISTSKMSATKQCMYTFLPPANEVCEGYVFTPVCHSVHRRGVSRPRGEVGWSGWGGCLGPDPGGGWGSDGGVSRPRPKGKIGGSGQGCVCPGPHPAGWTRPTPGGCPGPGPGGCIPTCTQADTPPSRWLLLWVVCILLECILVRTLFSFNPFSYLSSEKNSFWQ